MEFSEILKDLINSVSEGDSSTVKSFMDVAKKIGFNATQKCNSASDVSNYIYSEIREKLKGEELEDNDFECIRSQFLIEYFTDIKNEQPVRYIEIIRDATRELKSYTKNSDHWGDAVNLVSEYIFLRLYDPLSSIDHIYHKERSIAESIKYFKSKGFDISVENGESHIPDCEHKRIASYIDLRFKRLGMNGSIAILNGMKSFFNEEGERYFFQRISSTPLVPWGYLFRLSVKHLQKKKRNVGYKKDLIELIDMGKNYATILNVQEYSQYEWMNQRPDTILKKLQNLVLNDQVYSLPQTNCADILEIVDFIFSRIEEMGFSIRWKVDEYLSVAEAIHSISNERTPVQFSLSDISIKLNDKVLSEVIADILRDISHDLNQINSGYILPFDATKSNQSFKPLICIDGFNYMLLDMNLFSFGFYEVISSAFRHAGVKDSVIGDLLEDFISHKFTKSGVSFLAGEKYKINKARQKSLATSRSMGECDFVVETDEVIIFIEVKKKILTRAAQGGDITNITTDLIKSFANAQIQANWHEIILRKEGSIKFESGKSLILNGRDVEKISLSMFDYMALHDGVAIHQIMNNMIGRKLTSNISSAQSSLNSVNKALSELSHQYNLPELNIYQGQQNAFFNCRFFSLLQFMKILSNSRDIDSFKEAIWANRHVSTGEKDWFREMSYLTEMKSAATAT